MVRSFKQRKFKGRKSRRVAQINTRVEVRAAAVKALRLAKKANKSIKKKENNTVVVAAPLDGSAALNPTNSGLVYHINGVQQGVGQDQRIGNKIKSTSLRFRYDVDTSQMSQNDWLRIVIVRDTDTDENNPPTWTPGTALSVFESIEANAMRNIHTMGRYRVMYDKLIKSPYFDNNMQGSLTWSRTVWGDAKLKTGHIVTFNGSATTDPSKNAVYLMLLSDGAAVGQAPILHMKIRHWYKDL